MKTVYEPGNAVEAHMIKDYLRQEDIPAVVHGASLTGAVGELPAAGLVRVVVEEEYFERAREAIRRWESDAAMRAAEADAAFAEDAGVSADAQPEGPFASRADAKGGSGSGGGKFRVGLAALVLGIALGYVYYRVPMRTDNIDHNADGKPDEFVKRALSGTLNEVQVDRNFDGRIDMVTSYGSDGDPKSAESDDDFDGVFESRYRYALGSVTSSEVDTDGDRNPNVRFAFKFGVIQSAEFIDPYSGRPMRQEHYHLSQLVRAEVDIDGDGAFDKRLYYSPAQEVQREERIR